MFLVEHEKELLFEILDSHFYEIVSVCNFKRSLSYIKLFVFGKKLKEKCCS